MRLDPLDLARQQLDSDRLRTARRPRLLERKNARLGASPFAFLRGAAPLFYAILKQWPELAEGPTGEGLLVGDLHLENFGAFRTGGDPSGTPARSVFDVNDLDEATRGPLRLDVLRLTTSVILAARGLGVGSPEDLHLARSLVDAYVAAADPSSRTLRAPPPISAIIERGEENTTRKLLAAVTTGDGGRRRLHLDDDRRLAVTADERAAVVAGFEAYAHAMAGNDADLRARYEVRDVSFRVAGTGSLGCERFLVLTRDRGGKDDGWLFDMKEEGEPAAGALLGPAAQPPARRVADAIAACLVDPPRQVGVATVAGRSMLVRRLAPTENKLEVARLERRDFAPVLAFLGAHVAHVHARTAVSPAARWTAADASALVEHAALLAGLHEAVWLAHGRL